MRDRKLASRLFEDAESLDRLEQWARKIQRRNRFWTRVWSVGLVAGLMFELFGQGPDRHGLLVFALVVGMLLVPAWVRVRWARPRILALQRQLMADRGLLDAEAERSDAALLAAIESSLARLDQRLASLETNADDGGLATAWRQRLDALGQKGASGIDLLERSAPEIARVRIADPEGQALRDLHSERRRLGARLESFRLALLDLEMDLLLLTDDELPTAIDRGLDEAARRLAIAGPGLESGTASSTPSDDGSEVDGRTGTAIPVGAASPKHDTAGLDDSTRRDRILGKGRTGTRSAAENLVLRGRFFWNRRTPQALERALDCFERALGLDPDCAEAHTGIADVRNLQGFYSIVPPGEAFPEGRAAAEEALLRSPELPEALASKAFGQLYYEWDFEAAEASFLHALDLEPDYASAHHWYAEFLAFRRRHDESEAHARRALDLEPLSLIFHTLIGWVLYYAGRSRDAIEALEEGLGLDPRFAPAEFWLGLALEHQGELEEAVAALERSALHSDRGVLALASLARLYAETGRGADSQTVLDEIRATARERYVPSYHLAAVELATGDTEGALGWLERALEERSNWMLYLGVDPAWEPLHGQPRWKALVTAVGLPED